MKNNTYFWTWQGHAIACQSLKIAPDGTPPIVFVHGFGANLGHWRKNIPVLGKHHPVHALDLLGFGGSAKPGDAVYAFETWGTQVADFTREVVGAPAILVGNSIGAIVALQAAVSSPEQVAGVVMINCSLRLLHDRKRQTLPWLRRTSTPLLQRILSVPALGRFFFERVRKPASVRRILKQAYVREEAVTDELIDLLCKPAHDPGAAEVFLSFINYSGGPLAEDLLPQIRCPVLILWGEQDPWEPIALGRELADYPCVRKFVPIQRAGHCPQDEAPEEVNEQILAWIQMID